MMLGECRGIPEILVVCTGCGVQNAKIGHVTAQNVLGR